MNLFKGYKLEENESGYTLVLYLNPDTTEFAEEITHLQEGKTHRVINNIEEYIKQHFKDLKVTGVKIMVGSILIASLVLGNVGVVAANTINSINDTTIPQTYTVQSGDTLWEISQTYGVDIDQIKSLNGLTGDNIYVGQELKLKEKIITKVEYDYYTVQSGDNLWGIANSFGVTVTGIKQLNNLDTNIIYPGQRLKVREIKTQGINYTVESGDTLWEIAQNYDTTIDAIKDANDLDTDAIFVGQVLFVPISETNDNPPEEDTQKPQPVQDWPDVTYIVQPGDSVTSVALKFDTSIDNILRYNYMEPDEWLNAGDRIAISGYAPRTYTVTPGEATAPARTGKIVDWFTEGQYIMKRGDIFTVVDVETGRQFTAKMIGGYNHSDIEPLTDSDAYAMRQMFGSWRWSPRAVVIYVDGINIAGSLSGMPHGADVVDGNNVTGHFDLYLLNSTSHNPNTSQAYIDNHQDMVRRAAGQT